MSTAQNIFPQLQQSQVIKSSRVALHKQLADANKLKLKTIEAQYFQNEYKNILTAKERQKELQRQQRQRDRQIAQANKIAYSQQLQRQMQKKQLQRAYLALDYQNTIEYQLQKKRNEKNINQIVDREILNSPTWLRDASTEREMNIRKKLYYNQILDEQLQLQQQKRLNEKLSQQMRQEKIKKQAEDLLDKQLNQMENKHRQKSLFQERQNQLLGIGTQRPNLSDSRTFIDKQRQLKNTQRQIYRQGLQAQYQKQQNQRNQRRRAFSQNKQELNPIYNPITNPIPFVYKNPNVLRMLNQL